MKIFWAWQSDTPGRIGRHFVRDALDLAIGELRQELFIAEPERGELHLDHDRKGVPGSPDLARTILDKINESVIVVADVTPVGTTEDGKTLVNSNVAIELGYALKHLGDQALLMVLNEAFGDRSTLPFDLRHKAGPIIYNLNPDSNRKEIESVQRILAGHFKVALRDCLARVPLGGSANGHEEIPCQSTVAQYFADDDLLVEDVDGLGTPLVYPASPLLYLRVIPRHAMPDLRSRDLVDLVRGINISPLRLRTGGGASWARNRHGGITYSFLPMPDGELAFTSTQVFPSREIWGLDATLFRHQKEWIREDLLEEVLEEALNHYLEVGRERLGLNAPLEVEAGAAHVKGLRMVVGDLGRPLGGPIYQEEIQSRHTLGSFDRKDVNLVLLAIFEDLFDAVGERRWEGFRGFPPEKDEP